MTTPEWILTGWAIGAFATFIWLLLDDKRTAKGRGQERRLEGLCDLEDLWNLPAREPRRRAL